MQPYRVILNPSAGNGDHGPLVDALRARLPAVQIRMTSGAGDARRWAREAAEEGVGVVVAGGGDGTLHQIANGLLEASGSSTALGILPLGTGNDLARSLGIPLDPDGALGVIEVGASRRMDVVRISLDGQPDRFILNAVTGGFSGQLHEAVDPAAKTGWGSLGYLRKGLEAWGEHETYALEIELEGALLSYRVLNVMICNGGFAGGGIPLAPNADPFDGWIDVALILDAPGFALSMLAARVLAGQADEHEALARFRTRSLRITTGSPLPLSLDGEPAEALGLTARVEPGRLPVLVSEAGQGS